MIPKTSTVLPFESRSHILDSAWSLGTPSRFSSAMAISSAIPTAACPAPLGEKFRGKTKSLNFRIFYFPSTHLSRTLYKVLLQCF
jgi:hypothetical protein